MGSPILLKIVSENQFSGKTYFYTIAFRAKTSSGKWMSLVDTEDGTVWARPADVACTECGLVFFDALARDQHFKASHQLLHCQGCVHQLSVLIQPCFLSDRG